MVVGTIDYDARVAAIMESVGPTADSTAEVTKLTIELLRDMGETIKEQGLRIQDLETTVASRQKV